MLTMKKDMGGAAHVLGLASMVMAAKLDVNLRVLLAVVENAISADAFRPGDVLVARNGRTTEIGNTDAEGRLVLADALVLASEGNAELIIDMATLTGASRVALGTDVPSIFSNDDALAQELQALSALAEDHVWQLPLWEGYRKQLKSTVADLKNIGAGAYGGAITAALYLDEFVGAKAMKKRDAKVADADDEDDEPAKPGRAQGPSWLHMDVMAYNTAASPGRPEGGEAMGMRAFYALLEKRYPAK
jgi:leucyl aminopeptidase